MIIPVLDNGDVLEDQLRAVTNQHLAEPWELVIADNGSTDRSVEVASRFAGGSANVRLVDASARRGPGAARNIGVEVARGHSFVFCDGDDVVQPGWLAACACALEGSDAVVGAIEHGALPGSRPSLPRDPWPFHFQAYLRAGLAANMGVSRAAFEAVGGFAEELTVGEDLDLCWRLQLAGFRLEFVPDAVVTKRGKQQLADVARQSFGYGRSDALLYKRFREAGMPRNLRLGMRTWAWLATRWPTLVLQRRRRLWVSVLFVQIGRISGSLRHGVLYL